MRGDPGKRGMPRRGESIFRRGVGCDRSDPRRRFRFRTCRVQALHLVVGCESSALNFEAVRALGREFPDLQESTMYGSPALKLGKRLVACLAIHRSAEPGSLVVRTDFEQRAALLDRRSGNYYVTDHYAKHPVVLVRLARVQHDQLRDLLAAARQCVLVHRKRSCKRTQPKEYRMTVQTMTTD